MLYCNGEGRTFNGSFNSDFINCDFNLISNCIFRSGSEIKFAVFRSDFSGVNFDTDTNIQNLKLLYDSDHQVNIYNHKGKVTISCDVCNSPVRGEIKMWSGTVSDIPEGWHICDGTEGTPDLTDRFIIAGTSTGPTDVRPLNELKNGILIKTSNLPTNTFTTNSSGNHSHSYIGGSGSGGEKSGGSNSSNTTGESGEHTHTFRLNTGNQERLKTIPNYYTLIFIMKL